MRAVQFVFSGLLFIASAIPAEAENVLQCTFKQGGNEQDDRIFKEQIAWRRTKDFPQGISGPILFEKTGEMGEPQHDMGVIYDYARHDDLGIVAALDPMQEQMEKTAELRGARYFYYDRKTGVAQLISVTDATTPAMIEIGICAPQPK